MAFEDGMGAIGDAGASGGDAGAGGGDAGGGTAVEEPPVGGGDAEGGEPAGGEAGAAPEGGEKPPEGDVDPNVDDENPYDGRKIDDATKKSLAALRKANPALARTAADAIFGRKAIMAEFPEAKGISEVISSIREIRQTIEAVGGQEGLTKLQESNTQYQKEIDQFAAGDPELGKMLHESDPEGYAKQITNGLQLLMELNGKPGELFDRAMAVPFAHRLHSAGMDEALAGIENAIKNESMEDLLKWTGNIRKWYNGVKEYASQQKDPNREPTDPRERELNAREARLKEQETANQRSERLKYEGEVGADVNTLNNQALKPLMDAAVRDLKLQPAGAKRLTDTVQREVWAAMKADKVFQRNAENVLKKNDKAASAKFVNAKFTELLPAIYRKVRNDLYPAAGAPKAGNAVGAAASGKPAAGGGAPPKVDAASGYKGGRPTHEQVDWGQTDDMDWIRGVAVLKGGKRITFDPNSPPNRFN